MTTSWLVNLLAILACCAGAILMIRFVPLRRLLILLALIGCGLGIAIFIPSDTKIEPCRVVMQLPESLGAWMGKDAVVTQKEHDMLAEDTKFCRKVYDDGFGGQVYVSIVLSGNDLDHSIHRPERCLPAQGWTIVDTSSLKIPVPEAPGGNLPVTRLHNMRQEKLNGHIVNVYNLNYYWFVGYSDITANHFQREYIDLKDRLLHGYNQRWAYVTVAATVTKNLIPFGRDEAQTDAMVQKLITMVYPRIVTNPQTGQPLVAEAP
jgi:EpsI family protein